jgi:acetyl esterase/lipase
MIRILLAVLLGVGLSALDEAGDTPGDTAPSRSGLAYGADPRQVLDLWLPPTAGTPPPLVVWVHGGGWRMGDRRNTGTKPAWTVAAGWAFASVEYRLSPQVRHPAHAEDVATAIAWLSAQAPQLGFDGRRIALLGHSAGAHLVAVVGTDAALRRRCGLPDGILKAVIGLDGAGYDIARTVAAAAPRAQRMYSDAFGGDPAGWPAASPALLVRNGQIYPPFLLPYVAHRETSGAVAEDFATRLRAVGVEAMAMAVPDSSHALINRRFGGDGDAVTVAAHALLTHVFANPSAP